jgi:hypothetical protein
MRFEKTTDYEVGLVTRGLSVGLAGITVQVLKPKTICESSTQK